MDENVNTRIKIEETKNEYESKNNYYKRIKLIKRIITYVILTIISIYAVFPIYYMVILSFSPISSLGTMNLSAIIPNLSHMVTSTYVSIVKNYPFFLWLRNTLFLTGVSSLAGVGLSITSGIVMSRFNISGKKALLYMLLILTTFPMTIMVIPYYFMFAKLHFIDNIFALLIPYSAGAVIFATYLIKNYVDAIPRDYEEAAQLDGYSKTHALFKVLIPSSFPVIVFAFILSFMGPYTDYALAGQFLTSAHLYTMAIGMYYVSTGTVSMNYNVFAAFAVLMGIPIFIIFFIFQKYLVSGFSIGKYK
jgi:arabinogalactan oligomer/maltooligosaccharide transport system permease protein